MHNKFLGDDSKLSTIRAGNSQFQNIAYNNPDVSILSDFQFDNSKGLYNQMK